MKSLLRHPFHRDPRHAPPDFLWKAAAGLAAAALLMLARACGYDSPALLRYGGYLAAFVVLPGVVALYALEGRPLTLATVAGLALPTGFALEIFSYLGCAATGARSAYTLVPVGWLAAGVLLWFRRRESPIRWRICGAHAGVAFGLAAVFFGLVLLATSQMFAESPLAGGLPARAIFHDWVYLVSRAADIKNNWPLDDPSLAGTPMQYHYFMMVHAAAASGTTGVELTLVLLRLMIVPLGAALVAQAYLMGRQVARSPWGGVGAAALVIMAGEVSTATDYGQPMFLGLFARWLFVSPTFFFGMIFCGALLLATERCLRDARGGIKNYAWLFLLGAAGTGAKGTLLPVILCGLALWTGWTWVRERRFPARMAGAGLVLSLGFALVYLATMASWGSGNAAFRPFHVFRLTTFWQTHLAAWQGALGSWLPGVVARPLGMLACAAVVFMGTCGVRLLAIPYVVGRDRGTQDPLAGWLGAFTLACVGMGLLMELNSYGELYLILMIRLPMSVLAAAYCVEAHRRWRAWQRDASARPSTERNKPIFPLPRNVWPSLAVGALAITLALQLGSWLARNQTGFLNWIATPPRPAKEDELGKLEDALVWLRQNTPPNAVVLANACTPENMAKDNWSSLDRTLTGVHFYYSALSERRLWFEGPHYLLDATRARIRAHLASNFFYRGAPIEPALISSGPCYVLLDRAIADGAKVMAPGAQRVFGNTRIDIYRLSRDPADRAFEKGIASVDRE